MNNPDLQAAQAAIDKAVKPADRQAYDRIVVAGMKVMFSKQTHNQIFQGLEGAQDPVALTAEGAAGLMLMLREQSRNTMPMGPMIMAGQSLLLEALDFIEQGGLAQIKVDKAVIAQATQHYIETILPKIGMTPEKMQATIGQTQGVMNDPKKMAAFKQSMGG